MDKNKFFFHGVLLLFIPLFFYGLASCKYNNSFRKNRCLRDYILTPDSKPSDALLKLLNVLEVKHDGSLLSIVKATQQSWLRKEAEIWYVQDVYSSKKDLLMPLLEELNLINSIYPLCKKYDYVLFMGALHKRVLLRLGYLLELWECGLESEKIIIFGGLRPLDNVLESRTILYDKNNHFFPIKSDWKEPNDSPLTEIDMLRFVWSQVCLPVAVKEENLIFIKAPMKKNKNDQLIRPTSEDTVFAWLNTNPTPGRCLVISNQPFCGYHDATLRKILPASFSIETVGERLLEGTDWNIAVLLDSLARWLYQEQSILEKNNSNLKKIE